MQPKKLIQAKRKRLLRWLVLIQLWNPAKDTEFSSQKGLLKAAAAALGSSEGAVKNKVNFPVTCLGEPGRIWVVRSGMLIRRVILKLYRRQCVGPPMMHRRNCPLWHE